MSANVHGIKPKLTKFAELSSGNLVYQDYEYHFCIRIAYLNKGCKDLGGITLMWQDILLHERIEVE